MKKTIIALMALAGVAGAATKTLWTVDFGTEYQSTGYYKITSGAYDYKITQSWDMDANYFVSGGVTSAAGHRPHIRGNTGVTWDDDFAFTLTFTVPSENISASNNWPVIAGLEENTLRFGPYTGNGNVIDLDGSISKVSGQTYTLTGGTHTAILSVVDRVVSLTIDGTLAATATLNDGLSGAISNITLGGGGGSDYRINETIHSMSMSLIVPDPVDPSPSIPEPATATLSLLALAGLAARRRRK
ncbi:MAG: PEP-CTERM sorting domain-containing protein [Akkermansia sp.]|nr:PEP-CTERM sorting domain-containing protein [Akkermansia sp.]